MKSIDLVFAHFKDGIFDWKKGYHAVYGKRRFSFAPMLYAAAAVALAAFLFVRYQSHTAVYLAYDVAQTFTLPDGSRVKLQPGSKLSLKPRRDPRNVYLDGTALFSVEKTGGKPFTVKSEDAYVKVLGTVFQFSGDTLDVYQGKVLFAPEENAKGIIVAAGESAVMKDRQPTKTVQRHHSAAWATGRFSYDNTPLHTVLAELSEYYGVSLTYENGAEKRLTAEFSNEKLEEIVGLIESALDITITFEK